MRGNEWSPAPLEFLTLISVTCWTLLLPKGALELKSESACAATKARYAVLCSSISDAADMSWPYAQKVLFSTHSGTQKGANIIASPRIRAHWRKLCEANGPAAMVEAYTEDFVACIRLRCPPNPRLEPWIQFLGQECEGHMGGNLEPVYQAYGVFLTWLSSLDQIPTPREITREHIRDIRNLERNTFRKFLEERPLKMVKNRNKLLSRIASVFDRLETKSEQDGIPFVNPIRYKIDRFLIPAIKDSTGPSGATYQIGCFGSSKSS